MSAPQNDTPGLIALIVVLVAAFGFMAQAVINCFVQVCSKGAERDVRDGYSGEDLDVLP